MVARSRKLPLLVALVLAAFGVGCLNYTKAFGVEHHYEWAEASGFPEPSGAVYFLGVGATLAGAGWMGFLLGSRRRAGR